jgi:hypothetical protein
VHPRFCLETLHCWSERELYLYVGAANVIPVLLVRVLPCRSGTFTMIGMLNLDIVASSDNRLRQ